MAAENQKKDLWAILIRDDGEMRQWPCDKYGHLPDGEWIEKKDCYKIPIILDIAPPEETPYGVRRKQKGLYLLKHRDAGPCTANKNDIATDMVHTFFSGIDVYGGAILMDAEADGKPIGLPWDEAAYIIEQWEGGKQG